MLCFCAARKLTTRIYVYLKFVPRNLHFVLVLRVIFGGPGVHFKGERGHFGESGRLPGGPRLPSPPFFGTLSRLEAEDGHVLVAKTEPKLIKNDADND